MYRFLGHILRPLHLQLQPCKLVCLEKVETFKNSSKTYQAFYCLIRFSSAGIETNDRRITSRSGKPCVGGYTPKRPRFEPEVEAAPETHRGSTYFPTGDNRRPPSSSSEDATTTTRCPFIENPFQPKTFKIKMLSIFIFWIFYSFGAFYFPCNDIHNNK
jgi:hypothetical protein